MEEEEGGAKEEERRRARGADGDVGDGVIEEEELEDER